MITFLEENEFLWNKKSMGYRKPDLKTTKWEAQAEVIGKSAEHLLGWHKSLSCAFISFHLLGKPSPLQSERTLSFRAAD